MIVAVPHTPATRRLLSAAELAMKLTAWPSPARAGRRRGGARRRPRRAGADDAGRRRVGRLRSRAAAGRSPLWELPAERCILTSHDSWRTEQAFADNRRALSTTCGGGWLRGGARAARGRFELVRPALEAGGGREDFGVPCTKSHSHLYCPKPRVLARKLAALNSRRRSRPDRPEWRAFAAGSASPSALPHHLAAEAHAAVHAERRVPDARDCCAARARPPRPRAAARPTRRRLARRLRGRGGPPAKAARHVDRARGGPAVAGTFESGKRSASALRDASAPSASGTVELP